MGLGRKRLGLRRQRTWCSWGGDDALHDHLAALTSRAILWR
jgi:hypothetical protein